MAGNSPESRPDTPTTIDYMVEEEGGTTLALELLPARIEEAKEISKEDYQLYLVRTISCLQAEIKYLRKVRRAAMNQCFTNLELYNLYWDATPQASALLDELYQTFENIVNSGDATFSTANTLPSEKSAVDALPRIFETCCTALQRIKQWGDAVADSSATFQDDMNRIGCEWIKCFENRI